MGAGGDLLEERVEDTCSLGLDHLDHLERVLELSII